MHEEPYTTGPSWVPLHDAAERLSRYLGDFTLFALNDILAPWARSGARHAKGCCGDAARSGRGSLGQCE